MFRGGVLFKCLLLACFFALVAVAPSFARQSLDESLLTASTDIVSRCVHREIIAILDFSSEEKEMGRYIQECLLEHISQNSDVRIVTRKHMDKVNAELDYQMSGAVSDETALSICERLGAQKIVFGSFSELENAYVLQVRVLEVETGAYALLKKYDVSRSAKTEQLLHRASKIYKSSIGFMLEANKHSISHIAPAVGISFDYSLSRRVSLGVKSMASYDVVEKENTVFAIEPLAFLRWYAVSPSGEPGAGLFVEGQGGGDFLLVNSALRVVPSAGGVVGFRFVHGSLCVEPYVRGGYPYIFGAGVTAGFRF